MGPSASTDRIAGGVGRETEKMSLRSTRSVASVYSIESLASVGSSMSIGSAGSIASIGSAGSILSIGSAGSILSFGSAGSLLSVGSAGSILSRNSQGCMLCRDNVPMKGAELAAHVGAVAAIGVVAGLVTRAVARLIDPRRSLRRAATL